MTVISEEKIVGLLKEFGIVGQYIESRPFSNGLINTTACVTMMVEGKEKKYVLQKINTNVFKKPEEVMENIANVTNFIRGKLKAQGEKTSRKVMKFYKTHEGKYYFIDENGDYWRVSKCISKSVAYDVADLGILEETGKAIGDFQCLLEDFPVEELNIIIPHFHNTVNRYEIFEDAIDRDPVGRVARVKKEIEQYRELEEIATELYRAQKRGDIPLRVTHNDTKCNNVLMDEDTGKFLCMIDLDTIMPGLPAFDIGDAIRFGANTANEDESDLSKVRLDFAKFEALIKGFVSTAGRSLTKQEQESLALGALTMTTECGVRFLTDYIDGDNYFKTQYLEHNLDRARCQLTLAQDMYKNLDKMNEIVYKYCQMYAKNY